MKLIETKISETSIRMRYADDADPVKASQWIDFQIPIADLEGPDKQNPLGDIECRYLAELRLVALRNVRDVIGDETRRLSGLADRIL